MSSSSFHNAGQACHSLVNVQTGSARGQIWDPISATADQPEEALQLMASLGPWGAGDARKPCGPRCSPVPVADAPNVEAGFRQAAVFSLVASCPLKAENFSNILGVSESPPMQRGPCRKVRASGRLGDGEGPLETQRLDGAVCPCHMQAQAWRHWW